MGRASAKAVEKYVSPGERNPIEGKLGQAKNGYRYEPYQGKAQKHQPVMDHLHYPSAQPGQIGRGSTILPEFFSMEGVGKTHIY
ncbi:hypothetical protein EL17_23795 [Anditalea andensis]|uniref:Uncharacterized protein n=1 Tax=Anditalea andensis TaxID=1048983 RepID=A0A074L749_9BACT|nr:hypothetical protein EL17_23795 [Anditalea andensis]